MDVPGEIVQLAGRQVHRSVRPGERPGILLVGGCGVPSSSWGEVVALLDDLEVVLLDRPGMGGSRWPGVLPTLVAEVDTLAAAIEDAGAPMLIVAHSMAGLHAEALARLHPHLVAGLVLVDGSVEWERQGDRYGRTWLRIAHLVRRALTLKPLLPVVSFVGRVMFAVQSGRRLLEPLDPITRDAFRSRETAAMVIAEQAAYGRQSDDLDSVRKHAALPEIPVLVITATGDGGDKWRRDQQRLAELLNGWQLVDEEARHLIMIDRPDLVADAVRAMHVAPDSPPEGQQ